MKAWDVYLPHQQVGVLYDRVFFTGVCDAEYVKVHLIQHDGYPSDIVVVPEGTDPGQVQARRAAKKESAMLEKYGVVKTEKEKTAQAQVKKDLAKKNKPKEKPGGSKEKEG